MKKITLLFASLFLINNAIAQSHNSTQSHQGIVNDISIIKTLGEFENAYYTAGEDGFVIKWTNDGLGEHYQITEVGIKIIAVSPNGNDIAVYESDGGSVNKVSVWDWKTLTRKKQFKYNDSITSLEFSAKGTYLIIGTATVDGAVFIRTSNWTPIDKIKTNTSIVNYITTSDTEKTCVFYSPTGNLSYYNLGTGELKDKFSIMQGLSQCVLYNDNKFFAGVRDDSIYLVNAFRGDSISKVSANKPIILSTPSDENLYYLENDGRGNYELKMLESIDTQKVSNPRIVKTMKGPRGAAEIISGVKNGNEILLTSKNGTLYKIDADPSITTSTMTAMTENTYSKIYDICASESDFYFLTQNAIFKSSYDTGVVDKLVSTNNQTNILQVSNDEVVLYSAYTKNPVILKNLTSGAEKKLFVPKNNIQSLNLSYYNNHKVLVELESNSYVNLYELDTGKYKEAYVGTGIQDALLTDYGLFIAKSASTNPKNPLIVMNTQTMETVPVSMNGNVVYGLSYSDNCLYGLNLVSNAEGNTTYVFSYNLETKQIKNILKFANEDAEAFTFVDDGKLFTNIGKNKIYCYNINTKKIFSYNRSASIPQKSVKKGNRVAILNYNGSISWCDDSSKEILADWYLTNDEQWYEF